MEQLVKGAREVTQKEEPASLTAAILYNQFVGTVKGGICHKINCGAGIGMPFAGPVSSVSFHVQAEKWLLAPSSWHRYDISCVARYEDDIFIAMSSDPFAIDTLFPALTSRSGEYRLESASVSHFLIHFLDVTVFKGRRWESYGMVDFSCYRKPSATSACLAGCFELSSSVCTRRVAPCSLWSFCSSRIVITFLS